jgi:hypothetical protein
MTVQESDHIHYYIKLSCNNATNTIVSVSAIGGQKGTILLSKLASG